MTLSIEGLLVISDIQHNDTQYRGLISEIQHNDTQHSGLISNIQHNDTQYRGLISDIQLNDTQQKTLPLCLVSHFIYCYAECRYAECRGTSLCRRENR
jgi:hypothetical protein